MPRWYLFSSFQLHCKLPLWWSVTQAPCGTCISSFGGLNVPTPFHWEKKAQQKGLCQHCMLIPPWLLIWYTMNEHPVGPEPPLPTSPHTAWAGLVSANQVFAFCFFFFTSVGTRNMKGIIIEVFFFFLCKLSMLEPREHWDLPAICAQLCE